MTVQPPSPAQRFSALLSWMTHAVYTQVIVGRLPMPLVNLIMNKIIGIRQRFARIAALVAAGKLSPRASGGPRPGRPPGCRDTLPSGFAWLIKLVPEAAAAGSHLRILLADPEMAALLAAAPASMARPLRSLCRMLGVAPPPMILAPPTQPPSPPPDNPPQAAPAAGRAAPSHPRQPRKPRPPTPRACGPPLPA